MSRSGACVAAVALVAGLVLGEAPHASSQVVNAAQCEIAPNLYAPCPKVEDDPAITGIHPHSKSHVYRISNSIPSGWRESVKEGARAWANRTTFGLSYGGVINHSDPETSAKIVWRGSIPSSWQSPNCPPNHTLACARWKKSGKHTTDVDFVYNKNKAIGTNTFNCFWDQPDVQALAVHEFGHWGVLWHTPYPYNAMFADYYQCIRVPTAYDQELMEYNFVKGGHTL